jgi:hypothetical protein
MQHPVRQEPARAIRQDRGIGGIGGEIGQLLWVALKVEQQRRQSSLSVSQAVSLSSAR